MADTIRCLIDEEQIRARVKEMGRAITEAYRGREVTLVCVLKGSFVFASDLARAIDLPIRIDFLGLRSYGDGTESSGVVQIVTDLSKPVEGRDVIVVEDIVDTGLTMDYLLKNLETRRPASVKVAALLHKPARTRIKVPIDFLGFTIEDVFIIGYGLDYAERYRNLPYLGVVVKDAAP